MGMTYEERETIKQWSASMRRAGDIEALSEMLVLIAHWMRQSMPTPFAVEQEPR